jgi:hypothetical protein
MPINFTDDEPVPTPSGVSIRAWNQNGKQVVVITSIEVMQDHGFTEIEAVASDKYD